MTGSAITTLVTDTLGDFSTNALTIVTAVIGIGVAFLLFRFGWRKVKGSMH